MRRLRVPDEVASLVRGLHPDLKRKVRAALSEVLENPSAGKALKDELDGMRSYPVGRIRIIYRESSRDRIEIVAIGSRFSIYQETYRLVKRDRKRTRGKN